MRVIERRVEIDASGASALTLRDSFSNLNTGYRADPAIGGFRILRSQPLARPARSRLARRKFSAARLPATGFLSVLLVGGFALAVLAGPANCPCGYPEAAGLAKTDAGARLISRLAYSRESMVDLSERVRARASTPDAAPPGRTSLPKLLTVAALDTDVSLSGTVRPDSVSPISTAAIPAVETPKARPFAAPQRLGLLPAEFENLTDTTPGSIKVAAATPADGELRSMLPTVELDAIVVEPARKPKREAKRVRYDTNTQRASTKTTTKRRAAKAAASSRLSRRAAARRAPRWSQQLYANPWQTKAFSYLR
jgi:hypothetical protein